MCHTFQLFQLESANHNLNVVFQINPETKESLINKQDGYRKQCAEHDIGTANNIAYMNNCESKYSIWNLHLQSLSLRV